jgi:MFS family permease
LSAGESLPPIAPAQLAGLLALGMLVGTINGLARVTMPLYASSVGAQPWQVGVIGGMGYAGLLLLALPMGAWIDRHSSRALFVRGVLVSALLYLALPWVHVPWQLMVAAWLLGLTLPFRTVPAQTEFLALVPRLSAGKAGWNRAANTVGMFFLGPAVGAAVIAALG